MDENACKEEFSYAYIKAIAAATGCTVLDSTRSLDNAGIDLSIKSPGIIDEMPNPGIDVQVKCTSRDILRKDEIRFSLPIKNYNELRKPGRLIPLILVVVLVPREIDRWITFSEEETMLRAKAYWISLKNRESVKNTKSITVSIPGENLLTVESLKEILKQVTRDEL